MRTEPVLEAQSANLRIIRSTSVRSFHNSYNLDASVPMEVLHHDAIPLVTKRYSRIVYHVRTGGLNVPVATSHLSLNTAKSARAAPGVLDLAVRTVKTEGSR